MWGSCGKIAALRSRFKRCSNVSGKREILEAEEPLAQNAAIEVKWNSNGELFWKVNKNLVGRTTTGIIPNEPSDSIQIGADTGAAIGDYVVPNPFRGSLSMLSFKYPNGT